MTTPQLTFRISPLSRRLGIFLLVTLLALIAASLLATLLSAIIPDTARALRVATVVQDCVLFILPPLITALLVANLPARLLCADRGFDPYILFKVVLLFVAVTPLFNLLTEWNQNLTLPQSLAPLEEWMRMAETNAAEQTDLMLRGTSTGTLIVNILIVGILAGVSEELFFRGSLQRLFTTGGVNIHIAVWATAFIFSAFHFQFFGFFPRLLLGVLFGYLLHLSGSVWLPATAHCLNNSLVVTVLWLHSRREATSIAELSTPDIINPSHTGWGYAISAMLTLVFLLAIFAPRKKR